MEANGNKVTSHVVKGLVLVAVLIVYAVCGELAHASEAEWFGWVKWLIFITGVIWSIVNYAAQMKGNVDFSTLLAFGLKLSAVVTCLYFLFSLLEMYVFFPGYLDEVVKQGLAQAAKDGKIDQAKFAENREQARKVVAVMMLAGVVMGTMIVGMLASLAGGALAKKNAT